MKKLLKNGLMAFMAMASAFSFASCSDDDDNKGGNPDFPKDSDGVYVLNQGNFSTHLEGMLSFIDYDSQTVRNNVFTSANHQSLGDTPQCGIVYDDKVYLGIYTSGIIWVLDDENKILKCLNVSEVNGGPRSMAAWNGYVYVSLFDGHVIKIDTKTLEVVGTLEVGANPETMCIYNGYLYVPNSGGMSATLGTTATKIDLEKFTVAGEITVPANPQKFITAGGKLYMLAWGDFYNEKGALYEVVNDQCKKVADATLAEGGGNTVYFVDAPNYSPAGMITRKLDAATGTISDWKIDEVVYPQGIGVDPITGNVFVSSLPMDGQYPSYTAPSSVCQYSASGAFVKKYEVGAGPAALFFDLDD